MSVSDDAARLANLPLPMGILTEVKIQVEAAGQQAAQILGQGAAGYQEIMESVQHALTEIDGAYNALSMIESALTTAANRLRQG